MKDQQEKDKFRKQTQHQAEGTAEAATRIKITRENMKRHRETKSPDAASTQRINNKTSMKRHRTAESSDKASMIMTQLPLEKLTTKNQ